MKKAFRNGVFLSVSALWFGLASPLSADIIYANTNNDLLTRFTMSTTEDGNEIILASTGNMTYFSFEYRGTNTADPSNSSFQGNGNPLGVAVDVKFYLNNGTPPFNGYPTPGTLLYDTGFFAISPTARSTFVYTPGDGLPVGGLDLTSLDITWSVTFENMGPDDSVGVDFYSLPTVGQAYGDYWENDPVEGWMLLTNTVPTTFGALMETPEPSSMTLSLLGGLGILIAMRRFRRKE